MIITNQVRHPIRSLEEWLQYAPPAKGEKHWKDGRSAKELAKAWMTYNGPSMPSELMDLLGTHSNTADNDTVPGDIPLYIGKVETIIGMNH